MFQNFEHYFAIYIRLENLKHQNYQNQNIEKKYLNNTQKKHRFVKVKNSLLQIENDFEVVKDGKLKKRNRRTIF